MKEKVHSQDKKLNINVLIEGNVEFNGEFLVNQHLHVIINKTLASLGIEAAGRELKRDDGTPLTNLDLTIKESGIQDGETLKFFKKTIKPDRDKGFA